MKFGLEYLVIEAYLLSLRGIIDDVSHDGRQQFSYVVYTSSKGSISCSRARGLPSFTRMF